MEIIRKIVFCSIVLSFCIACKKSSTPAPPVGGQSKCVIKGESTTLVSNEKTYEYQFDAQGNPTLVKAFNRYGTLSDTYELYTNKIIHSYDYMDRPVKLIIDYWNGDIFSRSPGKAFVSLDRGDTLLVNYITYFFFYDYKGRLITVGQQTDHIVGDYEYDLNITYNDQDNVTALQYEWTTGPRELPPPVIVTAYDDKPTPYAGVKGWPFLLINFLWNNYDPEPIITALSKNNPLDYTTGSGANLFKRTMSYTYNTEGFPTERKNTNKNANGEYTFLQGFSYDCK